MKRKNHWVLFAILLLALISLSPGEDRAYVQNEDPGFLESPPPPNREVEEAPGHIRVAVQLEPEAFKLLEDRTRIFMDSYHVSVDLVNEYGKDVYDLFRGDLALHDAPDVLLVDNAWIREFAVKGYLLPVDNYYSGAAAGNSLSTLQSFSEWNGYLWAIPKDMDPYVLVYNPETINKLGMNRLPETQAEWDKLYKAVKERGEPKTLKLLSADLEDPQAVLALLHRFGANLSLKTGAPSAVLSEEDRAAIRLIESVRPGLSDLKEKGAGEGLEQVAKGQTVLALVPYSEFVAHPERGLHAETPGGGTEASNRITLLGHSFVVTAETIDTETAGRWITAMTEAAEQKLWYEKTGSLPALKSLYDATEENRISPWLEAAGDKNILWSLPVGENTQAVISLVSEHAVPFLRGQTTGDAFMNQLASDLKPNR
ncbi:hypothetical protein AWM70_11395 [Paenibacillus yonginensis]|uniref:ABC transporter substrate-binding protein n=1 Tax=Paenibacillus yonginensis TaxID=1462996 RepID=A0A1B1N141_9BACL|nr:ABC transporter substrate-binding protein [Paenibacillus yonginensis]ANS75131.1 hypothetical protein AWM70_11395 [Paenibacillus yonginensis]